jgi:hypothetical protein
LGSAAASSVVTFDHKGTLERGMAVLMLSRQETDLKRSFPDGLTFTWIGLY